MRVTLVTMDLLAVLVLLDSRETVVSLDQLVPWVLLVPPDLLDPLELLADLEIVESLAQEVLLDPLAPLELEVPQDLLDLVVRRELLEKGEKEA